MNQFTEEQIQSLAPDPASIKAAQKVYSKANWEVFKSERAVWSGIKGSGRNPYLVRIDLEEIAFKCSCPSRKFPCKHGLSLGFYLVNHDIESIKSEDEPLWVKEWIDKRRDKVSKATTKPKKIINPEATKKRIDTKWRDALASIEYLELWIKDFVKNGLIDLGSKSNTQFNNLMKRMVDFKLPGINTFIRAIQNTDFTNKDWEEEVLYQIHLIHLLVQSIKKNEALEPNYRKELELLLGWNIKKEELLQDSNTEIVDDVWMIINVKITKEDNLTSRKVFLYGATTNRWAYILEFAFGGMGFSKSYVKEQKIRAKLAMYPGIHKTRAIIKLKGKLVDTPSDLQPIPTFDAAYGQYLDRKIAFPFTFELPVFVANAKIVLHSRFYHLVNDKDEILKCTDLSKQDFYKILAITKGNSFDAFVIFHAKGIQLLAIYFDHKISSLQC